ncbi:hypothetical protein PR048_010568 [Dryococelus australis]|uniref:Mutator-like transposase domain-containing protein n=1 Tax=Dryococelus australis TaxID=614101 RepID=A0ABQ9I332_9NEOP|nr:hypothetical protein PR048_010568 [Dryococelus australis]
MNLPPSPTRIQKYSEIIGEAVEPIAPSSMKAAAKEAVVMNEGGSDIPIAFDGPWQKRGHASKNSVATLTSIDTGTSGRMEADAAVKIFRLCVRYVQFLGDGDSKAYRSVAESKPYQDVEIKKVECVGHVQKRMGTRLRKFKQTLRATVMSDGQRLRDRLKDKTINELQQYYDLLIKCLHGRTQNSNESFNNIIWSRVPQNVFVGLKTFKWRASDAVLTFNDGNIGRIRVLKHLDIVPGIHMVKDLQLLDKTKIAKAERVAESNTKEARIAQRKTLAGENGDEEEDPDYASGCY